MEKFIFSLSSIYSSIRMMGTQYELVEKGWSYPLHRHPYYELIYCISGNLEQRIAEKTYILQPGEAIFVKSDFLHSSSYDADGSYFGFHFQLEDKSIHALFQSITNPIILDRQNHASNELTLQELVQKFIAKYEDTLTDELSSPPNPNFHEIENAVQKMGIIGDILIMIAVVAEYFIRSENMYQEADQLLKPAQIKLAHTLSSLLETRINEKMQMQEWAHEMNFNRSYMTLCFKKVYGMPPQEYFLRLKFRKAKELLLETDWSIERISNELSFSSQQHFSKTFRQFLGQSPHQFRKQR